MIKIITLTLLLLPFIGISQTENFWTKKNDFPGVKRERAVSFSIGNFGYIGTGADTAEIVLNDLWQYNPASDTWTQKANLPGSVRRDAVGFSIGNKGYIGTGIDNDESLLGVMLNDFWEYDTTSNSWTQKANYPGAGGFGVYFSTGFNVDSKGYICCGKVGPNTYTNELWEYKPSIDQWTQRTAFPAGVRYQLTSFAIGYMGYVGLGANQDVFKNDFWKYNPGTDQWTQIANLPASERGSACGFGIGNRGYICLGTDGGFLDDLWEYNPTNDQWYSKATYGGSARKNAVSFVINGKAYVGTGKGYSGKKASMEEYTPSTVLSLEETTLISFKVYPNPSSEYFSISCSNNEVQNFDIYTTDGKLVKEIKWNSQMNYKIDCTELNRGIYFVVAKDALNSVLKTEQIILL